MEDLSDVIEEAAVTVEVIRMLPPSVIKGRVRGAPEEKRFKIRASVQPMTQREIQLLPEGMRNQGGVNVYAFGCSDFDFVTTSVDGRLPDRIVYRGVTYQIALVDDWRDLGNYVHARAVRVTR